MANGKRRTTTWYPATTATTKDIRYSHLFHFTLHGFWHASNSVWNKLTVCSKANVMYNLPWLFWCHHYIYNKVSTLKCWIINVQSNTLAMIRIHPGFCWWLVIQLSCVDKHSIWHHGIISVRLSQLFYCETKNQRFNNARIQCNRQILLSHLIFFAWFIIIPFFSIFFLHVVLDVYSWLYFCIKTDIIGMDIKAANAAFGV